MVEGTVMVMALLLIVVSTGLMIATKDLKEKIRKYRQIESHLSRILQQITQLLDNNPNFEYRWNQLGSGAVCYRSSDAVVVFNEFPDKFEGFYVNNKEVTFRELLEVITE